MSFLDDIIFNVKDLCYFYADGTEALKGVSFSVSKNEKLALVGVNGSGKSTLLMHLMACLSPKTGSIAYKGRVLTKDMRKALRRSTGLLFQNPDDQLFLPTVWEDVAFGPRNLGFSESEVRSKVGEALSVTGIEHLSCRSPWKLSGGEKTLAALAGLLVMEPDVLLLDEPSAGLDPGSRRNLINIMSRLSCSIVVATHDLDLVLDLCDRVLVLKKGAFAGESDVPGILADASFMEKCGLELPLSLRGPALRFGNADKVG